MPSYDEVARRVDAIEAEMRRIGLWQDQPLEPHRLHFARAFAGDTMAFPQWLCRPSASSTASTRPGS